MKRIYIDNAVDDLEESFTYRLSEGNDDAFAYRLSEEPFMGKFTYRLSEYALQYDFTVVIPLALSSKEATIRSLVDFYKLAGKRYILKYF